ncbi:capsule assembly Wzi family protein [Pedobacter frigiditerrae]|uniref:capsule assembly Wzi family protein n=1 Tax=Pedobacter frigiditerrae TaxID=2530452 RepID=UPI00292FA872|nr:capsule assembly Wzi family protein [Pedobacter frigiditerrae]
MKIFKLKTLLQLLFIVSLLGLKSFAQTLPVGMLESLDDGFRRKQLLGEDSIGNSYMIRPLNAIGNQFKKSLYTNAKLRAEVFLLPIVLQQQYTTNRPYGINDGAMILARGYQSQISTGIFAKVGPLSVQLRPEFVFAENRDFFKWSDLRSPTGGLVGNPVALDIFRIDLPQKFDNGYYSRINWGQSNIRLTFNPVSIGLSTENLWWGPGVRNSLLMSNNAEGFKHLTLNTTRPIKTYIGSFETQIVGGHLEASGIQPPAGYGFKPKSQDWTYFAGIALTYQPKWVPNLFLGFDRSFIVSKANLGNGFSDYFPLFSSLRKTALVDQNDPNTFLEDTRDRDQYASAYIRWVLPETKAEIYFQFGRNDHPYDVRDLLVQPEHSSAYIAGFRKLVSLGKVDEYLQVGLELTKIEGSHTGGIRAQPSWYVHGLVPNGYTNRGQYLGAGIGSGSNMQTLEVSWVKGFKKIGLQIEKTENNNDIKGFAKVVPWTDLTMTGKFDWSYKNLIFSSQLNYIRTINYLYVPTESQKLLDFGKTGVNNVQLKVGVMYNFGD